LSDTATAQKTAAAQSRSDIYGLLAAVYQQEVTPQLLQQIRDPRFVGVLSALGLELEGDFFQKPEEELLEDLAVEFARLFLGPGKHISPHESVHHQRSGGDWGRFWGASTVKVKKFIESTGLSYADDYSGIPDHIAVEFEFMRHVTLCEKKAWEDAQEETAKGCRKIEKKFVEDHLMGWIPAFCDKVIHQAESPFYRVWAEMTKGFLEFEMENMTRNGDGDRPKGDKE